MTQQILDRRENLIRKGMGNWDAFDISMERMPAIAAEWAAALKGVDRPWLCWNVSERWCVLQQKLVQSVGWTPVVGSDPRIPFPKTIPGAIAIDFNKHFQFHVLRPMVIMEFIFLFTDRLAFWHSDLLCRPEVMEYLARTFESIPDGEVAAVPDRGGLRHLFSRKRHRYWELACCTTRGASLDLFEKGCGWWRHFEAHPNCTDPEERRRRQGMLWDHGTGIMYWKRRYGGKVVEIDPERLAEGHCTSINYRNYKRAAGPNVKNLPADLDANYNLDEVAAKLGIAHLLSGC